MGGSKKVRVGVVGGGAAGMMAALVAARQGAQVTILEKADRVGKKILATGNGRCNLSNTNLDISHYHGANPKFAYGALTRFNFEQTMAFFEELGIAWRIGDNGRVYPVSNQASSVLDVLRYELTYIGVEILTEAKVKGIKPTRGEFKIQLVDGRKLVFDKVIVAAGGQAAPNLGSDGSGFTLARQLGHSIITPWPALVQLKLKADFLKQITGIKFDYSAEIMVRDKSLAQATGEILFTNYGISGPPILDLSRLAGVYLAQGEKVILKLRLIDYMSPDELDVFLRQRLKLQAHKTLAFSLVGFINKRLVPVLLKQAGILDINKPVAQVTNAEVKALAAILQDWRLEVIGTNGWAAAQVTAGGVDVTQINQKTMASKLVPGLYFAGEVLDIDGDCGGYNLQWAWSSGYVAGFRAATS